MIDVSWDNDEHTIIRLDYSDPVENWDIYQSAIDKCYAMIRDTPHTVDIIHNPGDTKMPPGIAFLQVNSALLRTPQNVGTVTVVLPVNSFVREIIALVLRVSARKRPETYRIVKSLDEAYQVAKE